MDGNGAEDVAAHRAHTRQAYDRLAPVWSSTTDDGPFNGGLERPALRSLVPTPLDGGQGARRRVRVGGPSASGCWLWGGRRGGCGPEPGHGGRGRRPRCDDRGTFLVADLGQPLDIMAGSLDGITCSLVLHYLEDWSEAMRSFATVLRPGGWMVVSLHHPFGPALPGERGGATLTPSLAKEMAEGGGDRHPALLEAPAGRRRGPVRRRRVRHRAGGGAPAVSGPRPWSGSPRPWARWSASRGSSLTCGVGSAAPG